ncbi:MAG: lactonase family protein [Verrucomicrobiales bacterium]
MRCLLFLFLATTPLLQSATVDAWIGTFAEGENAGAYRAKFDTETGKLSAPERVAKVDRAGFLALSSDGSHAVTTANLQADGEKKPSGHVVVWRMKDDAPWEEVARAVTGGGVCHVSFTADGKTVLAANYGGGSVASFAFNKESGSLRRVSLIEHKGQGPHERQKEAHAHAFVPLPGGRHAAAPDLGCDAVVVYEIDAGASFVREVSRASTPPRAGPRHLAVGTDNKTIFVVNELDQTVGVFDWSAEEGKLKPLHVAAGRPDNLPVDGLTSAEIRVHPGGKFVYSSTRDLTDQGRDFITVFSVGSDRKLQAIQHVPAGVKIPRNFAISPDGKWLLAGGQASNTIQVHRIDPETGKLSPSGEPVACPAPVCFVFGK